MRGGVQYDKKDRGDNQVTVRPTPIITEPESCHSRLVIAYVREIREYMSALL